MATPCEGEVWHPAVATKSWLKKNVSEAYSSAPSPRPRSSEKKAKPESGIEEKKNAKQGKLPNREEPGAWKTSNESFHYAIYLKIYTNKDYELLPIHHTTNKKLL